MGGWGGGLTPAGDDGKIAAGTEKVLDDVSLIPSTHIEYYQQQAKVCVWNLSAGEKQQ